MRFLNYKFIGFTIVFGVGIILGFHILIPYVFICLILSLLISIITHFIVKKHQLLLGLNYLFLNFSILLLGYLNTQVHLPKHQEQHYNNSELTYDTPSSFKLKITEKLKPNAFNYKYYAQLFEVNNKKLKGKILLKINRDSINKFQLNIGDFVHGAGELQKFHAPENPQNFNYSTYMAHQNVYMAISAEQSHLSIRKNQEFNLFNSLDEIRTNLRNQLKHYNFQQENISLIEAFLLGQRQRISDETYEDFKNAGVIHILAVSGLHVGIILLILNALTHFCIYTKSGRRLRPFLVLIGLWGFAFLAGLSPSVFRATVMFSFLSIGMLLQKRTNSLNTLFMSGLVLVLVNPFIIYQVGFQLSYLAVFGIVTLQPRLYKLYKPRYYVDRLFWGIITVTLAAQLSIMPLSLYYFNQFSGVFLIANILILPTLSLILGIGILVLSLAKIGWLPSILVEVYDFILTNLRLLIHWLGSFEQFQFEHILFTKPLLWSSLIVVLSACLWSRYAKVKSYIALNISVGVLCLLIFFTYRDHQSQNELIILKAYNSSEIAHVKGAQLNLYTNRLHDSTELKQSYRIQSLANVYGLQSIEVKPLAYQYKYKDKFKIQYIDSSGVYVKSKDELPTIVFLSESPKLNLERLIKNIQPKLLIANTTNYKSYVDRWRETCKANEVSFHSIYEDGAFEFSEIKRLK
ncbi:competence protein ComEC [Psychroflexus salarius]|uniref:Competence protein ComEC n=1 Tax=Psychroflexus salarius TaxID=1155689 RepID=A0A1M4VTI3_9FLAO|nr:ComEC/Rec2 family competence protein [Psychroflexus salarius]SHE72122.1 competence protein ComEC [Psychroflexus salarius]